jgi:hypothetical protein
LSGISRVRSLTATTLSNRLVRWSKVTPAIDSPQ